MTTTVPAMVDGWEGLLPRISTLADDIPEIADLDFNPVMVSTDTVLTVDTGIRVAPSAPTTTYGATHYSADSAEAAAWTPHCRPGDSRRRPVPRSRRRRSLRPRRCWPASDPARPG